MTGGRPFEKGVSGNPAGRPKGSWHRLAESFIAALADDFERHGPAVIAQVRETDPAVYLRVAASLLPKEVEVIDDTVVRIARLPAPVDDIDQWMAMARSGLS